MNKFLLSAIIIASFAAGYVVKTGVTKTSNTGNMKRVTGVGGIFFKCKDPKMIREWYSKHLGMPMDKYGTNFEWFEGADSTKRGSTQWSAFGEKTKYFLPSEKDFMINYRVADLSMLVEELRKEGVTVVDSIATYDYGKFIHIMDPEGNKVELWEPYQDEYNKITGAAVK